MQVMSLLNTFMINSDHSSQHLLDTELSFEEYLTMQHSYLTGGKFEWFINGNLNVQEAKDIMSSVNTQFDHLSKHSDFSQIEKVTPVKIPSQTIYKYSFEAKNPNNLNSAIISYF